MPYSLFSFFSDKSQPEVSTSGVRTVEEEFADEDGGRYFKALSLDRASDVSLSPLSHGARWGWCCMLVCAVLGHFQYFLPAYLLDGHLGGKSFFPCLSLRLFPSPSQVPSESTNAEQTVQPNVLSIEVDKRITLGSFKKRLEPWLGTTSDHFKVSLRFYFDSFVCFLFIKSAWVSKNAC